LVLGYRGYYINLDKSVTRRQHIEEQLARYNLQTQYERFPAANGNILGFKKDTLNDSEMGCFTSHYLLLKQNIGTDQYLHIMEDDVIFFDRTQRLIDTFTTIPALAGYDIIFTETLVPIHQFHTMKQNYDKFLPQFTEGKFAFSLIDYLAGTTSYIIKPSSIRHISNLLEGELRQGTKVPIDIVIRDKAREGKIRTCCIFPFVTSILFGNVPESMQRDGRDQSTALAYDLARASFFIGRDLDKLYECSERISSILERDIHADLLARIHRLALSGKWRPLI
jgi:GR25 family glycosyltransferase involved in LPS biosynthesis